jgi:hypothetical protein
VRCSVPVILISFVVSVPHNRKVPLPHGFCARATAHGLDVNIYVGQYVEIKRIAEMGGQPTDPKA